MDRRIIKTRDAIKTAYMNLLIEKQNHKISIAELSREANIDRKTFYLHYNSVDDIMTEIIKEHLLEFEQLVNENNILQDTINVNILMQSLNICVMKNIDFYRSIANHLGFENFSKQMKEMLIEKSIASLSVSSSLSERDLRIYCNFLLSGIIDVYVDWFQNKISITLDELGQLTSNVMDNGVKVLK